MKHYDIKVYGKVHGVFYRANTVRTANELGVSGWVKNVNDGSVLISAEGQEEQLDKLVRWCQEGPSYAKVERVSFSEGPMQDFESFRIIR